MAKIWARETAIKGVCNVVAHLTAISAFLMPMSALCAFSLAKHKAALATTQGCIWAVYYWSGVTIEIGPIVCEQNSLWPEYTPKDAPLYQLLAESFVALIAENLHFARTTLSWALIAGLTSLVLSNSKALNVIGNTHFTTPSFLRFTCSYIHSFGLILSVAAGIMFDDTRSRLTETNRLQSQGRTTCLLESSLLSSTYQNI